MDENIIVLYDEDNNPIEFEIIDVFELNDNVYAAVTESLDVDEDETVEVSMLKVIEKDGEEVFSFIEDEQEEMKAYNELLRRDEEEAIES
ncbi:DUF1292 domain-containing protein [Acetivibrio sp. MSJd-27]|uniref:DUF1292 domain-containing protein n=1 Tax=Acetivibrio sp. MSJd-27 TaxID=2841523 RepID=UPI001C10B786|nr:DUF1292 domain-containing protein [Acetivibrio sp. MSJd-27]MBU5449727.1 DUF1292 domain-containing protein [Acetivibrio sp. MSJd-27]